MLFVSTRRWVVLVAVPARQPERSNSGLAPAQMRSRLKPLTNNSRSLAHPEENGRRLATRVPFSRLQARGEVVLDSICSMDGCPARFHIICGFCFPPWLRSYVFAAQQTCRLIPKLVLCWLPLYAQALLGSGWRAVRHL